MDALRFLGKAMIFTGALLIFFGAVLSFGGKLPFRLGQLPGDIVYRGKSSTVYFPLATCLLLSAIITAISWLIAWLKR